MSSPLPSLPVSQVTIPSTPLTVAAYTYVKQHTSPCTLNHVLRSTAFSLILQKKLPPLATNPSLDVEAIVLSTLLHDMGWATTPTLLSNDKRFEIDGANIARDFVTGQGGQSSGWDKHRVQLMWDAIALHTTPSIAHHKEPEVLATQLGIMADFLGPNLPLPGSPITIEEYKEIVSTFPRLGFKDEIRGIFCGMCKNKPEVTYDNFVGEYGKIYGLDTKGGGREEFTKRVEERNLVRMLEGGLDACVQFES